MNITISEVDEYIKRMSGPAPQGADKALLTKMHRYGVARKFPIIGPVVGRFLRQLAMISNAKRILELGSGFGYSAAWFAGGIKKGGRIICIDGSEENRRRALAYFNKSPYEKAIDFRVGDALEIARKLPGGFDIILNDIDKQQYPEAFDLAIKKLRRGGLFITDNVLWSGRILEKTPDAVSKKIIEFNKKLFGSSAILGSIIPIRDGLGLAVKR